MQIRVQSLRARLSPEQVEKEGKKNRKDRRFSKTSGILGPVPDAKKKKRASEAIVYSNNTVCFSTFE
jgi:hypothetical protein